MMKYIRKIKIKNRLIISFSIIPVIFILILGVSSYYISKNALYKRIEKYSQKTLDLTKENLVKDVQNIENIINEVLIYGPILKEMPLYRNINYMDKSERIKKLDNYFSTKLSILKNSAEVAIYDNNLNICYTQGFKYFDEKYIKIYSKQSKENDGNSVWFRAKLGDENYMGFCKAIKDTETKMIKGYLFIAIKEDTFINSNSQSNSKEDDNVIILNGKGEILAKENYDINISGSIMYYIIKNHSSFNNKISPKKINEVYKKYLINVRYVPQYNWYLLDIVSKREVLEELVGIRNIMILIIIICSLIIIGISVFIYKSICSPLYLLIDKINDKSFNKEIKDTANDELSLLCESFNDMIVRIKKLINDIETEQQMKREIEIRMLQAQIKPHFLFNTLNSLKWIATMNEDITVSEGLSSLALLLRNTIIDKNELISIKDEINNIKNYVFIQKIRYGDLFEIEYDIKKELLNKKIIKFILQPIVENSIIHGFSDSINNQKIFISIYTEKGCIKILVKDNGIGFENSNVSKKNSLSGIGLDNIKDRIKLTFGEEYGLYIKSKKGKGTKVILLIPIIDGEGI